MTKPLDIITIGAATRDVFLQSPAIKIVRDVAFSTGEGECFALGSKIDIEEPIFETGGGGTNSAVGFSRQGFRTGFFGKIGAHDARGREILTALEQEKVVTNLVKRDANKMTGYSVLLLTTRGERTVLVYRGASADIQPKDLTLKSLRASWWYVSSLGGNLRTIKALWAYAFRQKIRIAWNPGAGELARGRAALRPYLQQASIVIVNEEEAARLASVSADQPVVAYQRLHEDVTGVLVVTVGTEGAFAGPAGQCWHSGTHQIRVIDTTGAGDAFGCGFVGMYIRSRGNFSRSLQFATQNAESVVRSIGAKSGLLRRPVPSRSVPITRVT